MTWAFIVAALGVAVVLAAFLRTVVPTTTGGGDSDIYRQLAVNPLDPIVVYKNAIFQFRILVPAVVWALPLPTNTGFHVVTFAGLVASATLLAVLSRAIGVGRLALVAAPLTLLGFFGFNSLLQFRLVDAATVALYAGALLAAYFGAPVWCAVLSVATTAAKEIGVLLPVAYYTARARWVIDRPALATAALIAVPTAIVFFVLRLLLPHGASYTVADVVGGWWEGLTVQGQWGYPRVFFQVLLQNFGMVWLLWPLGVAVAPARWKRLHLFALALVPVLVGTHWARSLAYLLPFVLPSALLVLARGRALHVIAALVGSTWVAVLLSLRNIAVEAPAPFGSNAALLPGMALFAVAAFPSARDAFTATRSNRRAAELRRPAST